MSDISKRILLYKSLEKLRENPLIVYITSSRIGVPGLMASDMLEELTDQIEKIPEDQEEVDFLIESSGGDPLVAWRAISLLRTRFKKINVLIPNIAFSAATLLALGADEIVMGKYACLGPIDPQIMVKNQQDGSEKKFAYEDVLSLFRFTKKEVGLTEQKYAQKIFELLSEKVEPIALGFAMRASSLSYEIGVKLLLTHMSSATGKTKAREIAKRLNKNFFSHGHALYRKEAKKYGLKIVNASEEEDDIMWKIHKSLNKDLETNKPFNLITEFFSNPAGNQYLKSSPVVSIPAGANPQLVNQIFTQHIQAQLQQSSPDVEIEVKVALLESVRLSLEYKEKAKILVVRTIDLKHIARAVVLKSGWCKIKMPKIKIIKKSN